MRRRLLDQYRRLEEDVADKRRKVGAARNALAVAISEYEDAVSAFSTFAAELVCTAPPEEPDGTAQGVVDAG